MRGSGVRFLYGPHMKVWVSGIVLVLLAGAVFFYSQTPLTSVPPSEGPELNTATTTSIITMPPKPDSDFVPLAEEHSDGANNGLGSTAKAPDKICTGRESANFECYERHYVRLVKEEGIEATFDDLKARYPQNSYLIAQCHPVTHVIGREAALKFTTPGEAYVQGDSFCWSGYYHGVLETFVGKIGRKNLPKEIDRICDGVEGKERLSFD